MYTNIYIYIHVIYTLPKTNGWHVLTDGISRRKKFSWPTVNQFSGAKIFVCFREVIHIILFFLYCFFFSTSLSLSSSSTFQGVPIKPYGMVNWHPLGTIWHPLEGPGSWSYSLSIIIISITLTIFLSPENTRCWICNHVYLIACVCWHALFCTFILVILISEACLKNFCSHGLTFAVMICQT